MSTKLATAYQSAGRTREAVPLLAALSSANLNDGILALKVAGLQAWFGQHRELAATRQRMVAFAKGGNDSQVADRTAKVCCILPSTDKAELKAALALGRTAVKIDKSGEWNLVALGMAEYRNGNFATADEALVAVAHAKAGPNHARAVGTAAFYRAMSLFRQGKADEARKLATEAVATMKPFPKDENNPISGNDPHNDLILWLAFKEAKALIKFDATSAAPTTPDGK